MRTALAAHSSSKWLPFSAVIYFYVVQAGYVTNGTVAPFVHSIAFGACASRVERAISSQFRTNVRAGHFNDERLERSALAVLAIEEFKYLYSCASCNFRQPNYVTMVRSHTEIVFATCICFLMMFLVIDLVVYYSLPSDIDSRSVLIPFAMFLVLLVLPLSALNNRSVYLMSIYALLMIGLFVATAIYGHIRGISPPVIQLCVYATIKATLSVYLARYYYMHPRSDSDLDLRPELFTYNIS